jgi:hypothetical protein
VLIIQGRNDTRTPPRSVEVYEASMKALGKAIEVTGSRRDTARWWWIRRSSTTS